MAMSTIICFEGGIFVIHLQEEDLGFVAQFRIDSLSIWDILL